ncbi:hypothetical protein CRG98_049145, partial [Punica granatum]
MVASSGSVDPFTKVENKNRTCTLRAALICFHLLNLQIIPPRCRYTNDVNHVGRSSVGGGVAVEGHPIHDPR